MAEAVVKGIESSGVAKATLFRVPETLPNEVLTKMHAQTFDHIPIIKVEDLPKADGFIFGVPTRFGRLSAQVASFWDATGQLWAKGALVGKFAGIFASSGCQHGGIETTILSFLPNLVHHGMIYVPIGFAHPNISNYSEIIGSGPWGAGSNAGPDGSRQPSQKDLEVAEFQGKTFAELLAKRT